MAFSNSSCRMTFSFLVTLVWKSSVESKWFPSYSNLLLGIKSCPVDSSLGNMVSERSLELVYWPANVVIYRLFVQAYCCAKWISHYSETVQAKHMWCISKAGPKRHKASCAFIVIRVRKLMKCEKWWVYGRNFKGDSSARNLHKISSKVV